jgi:hypothetical protein
LIQDFISGSCFTLIFLNHFFRGHFIAQTSDDRIQFTAYCRIRNSQFFFNILDIPPTLDKYLDKLKILIWQTAEFTRLKIAFYGGGAFRTT